MNSMGPVLVGTDGSAPAQAAVRWAAVESQRRDVPLTILNAYDPTWAGTPGLPRRDLTGAADLAEAVVAEARAEISTLAPAVTVHTVVVPGDPAAVLLEHGQDAGLLVVGHRGRGGFTSLMLGSVSSRVSTHSRCTTVVVRGRVLAIDGPVIVGVDSSAGSRLAIGAAFDAARRRHTPVLAVHAYATPLPPVGPGLAPIPPPDLDELAKTHAGTVERLLAEWIDRFPDVPVQAQIATGTAAGLLVGASHHAQLVVVGSHGHGTVTGILLGSVGQQLLHHADCPILIARE
ncbi:nucleotide-binding universal stress UspA family protein [Actinoplanes octamycinicus]|uniref:Nucleotide-binding universal stress UspA family protein n=1 Tax=Actinoplanes octamycinicus TaxID=135948 RepID=A0A7W7H2R8_9ACTN|nr:universal stress protein [Actinoplanes octamycinicus]MBB4742910.1 nucleotide-binding universal stress UspA family protein [Actinoplanes octamycinicus]GIE58237.1 universal stress protein [Actinoplanes octamycinicus]